MDDRFLWTTTVCFVFNFCLLCSHRPSVSESNHPVPKPFLNKSLEYFLKDRINIYRKKSRRFKTWMEFVRQILMKLETSSNEGLLMKVFSHSLMWLSKHCSDHYVTPQACTLISWGCVHLRWCGSLEDDTIWCILYSYYWSSFGRGPSHVVSTHKEPEALTHRGRVTQICVTQLSHHQFRYCSTPNQYPNQHWNESPIVLAFKYHILYSFWN